MSIPSGPYQLEDRHPIMELYGGLVGFCSQTSCNMMIELVDILLEENTELHGTTAGNLQASHHRWTQQATQLKLSQQYAY